MDIQEVATDEPGSYSGDRIQSIQEHREGRDHVRFRHSEVFPEEIVFILRFDKWVGFRQAKQRAVQNPGGEQTLVNSGKEKFSLGGHKV